MSLTWPLDVAACFPYSDSQEKKRYYTTLYTVSSLIILLGISFNWQTNKQDFSEQLALSNWQTWNNFSSPRLALTSHATISFATPSSGSKIKHHYSFLIPISGAITTFYDIRGLTPYTEYEFVVLAVNNVGRGDNSVPVVATTGETGKSKCTQ